MVGYAALTQDICLYGWLFFCALINIVTPETDLKNAMLNENVVQTDHTTTQNSDSDADMLDYGLPGVQHEFSIEIAAGRAECFYQKLRKVSKLHVSFEVLRGADRNIDVMIKDPEGKVIESFQWTNEGNLEHATTTTGIYSFCIDNNLSRFSAKLVHFYMMSYSEVEWKSYVHGVEDFFVGVENFTKSIEKFDQQINKALVLQALGRQHLVADWYIIRTNNMYVSRFSIAMCVIIVVTCAFQVLFVRRLFNVSPKAKPRA